MSEYVLAFFCAALIAVVLWLCRMLVAVKTELGAEVGRRRDQDALNEARERAIALQRETLRNEFGELAARLLGDKQKALSDANEHSVGQLFRGLQEKLARYENEVGKAAGENARLGEHMKAQLAELQKFADRAQAFTAALTGGSKIQGNQGEEILANILERSGFQRGREYELQIGGRDEGRPDLSVFDAINRHIILVDSKMNIKDYIEASSLPDDALNRPARERALKAHAASVRRQIDNLASKRYAETLEPMREGYTILPLVAMFCPFNAVLEAALAQDPALMHYAYERKIVLVTPLTLWGYLWLVSWGWKQREVERRFDEIQKLGGDVVSALDALLDDIDTAGDRLRSAVESYENLRRRAVEEKGRMSVRRVARKLLEYGVAPAGKLKRLDAGRN